MKAQLTAKPHVWGSFQVLERRFLVFKRWRCSLMSTQYLHLTSAATGVPAAKGHGSDGLLIKPVQQPFPCVGEELCLRGFECDVDQRASVRADA